MSTLIDYLDRDMQITDEDEVNLPLFHNCSFDELITYLSNWEISAPEQPCDVFNEKLVYTFYGSSKFVSNKTLSNASKGENTSCLILDSNHCINIYKIFPFDSGAISGSTKIIRPAILKWDELQKKLNLGDRLDRINKMILLCFTDLSNYISGKIEKIDHGVEIKAKYNAPLTISHIKDTHNLMLDQSVADERRYNYEVLFKDHIKLVPKNLLGVIASMDLLTDDGFQKLLIKYRINPLPNLFYPSSMEVNYEIGKVIKEISIEFTENNFLNGRN